MNIYLIPGLGFDCRIFKRLNLPYPNITALNWIEPDKNESFASYASRLSTPIHSNEKNIIIGHSLGGMMAQEIASQKNIKSIFLISSIRSEKENPIQFTILKYFGLHYLFNKAFTLFTFPFWAKKHGYPSQEDQALFKDMVSQYSNHYLRWALLRLAQWKKPSIPDTTSVFQIIGDDDKNFPLKHIQKADLIIPKGSHFMIHHQATTISTFIQAQINDSV